MGVVHLLTEELSNRIAAGEVVERPASVLKELVENAIDAGATMIVIEIQRAGSKLIAVRDNGCGMTPDDALLCFAPHATSKIGSAADIERIGTLGFRGEALPSIASVSRLTLTTRQANVPEATEVVLEGGRLLRQGPAGGTPGTLVEVRDLFFNVPARKKFLRSPATEETHLIDTATMLALGFPAVGISLKVDDRVIFHSPAAADLRPRLTTLFGKPFVEKMLPVHWLEGGIQVEGMIAMPGYSRASRREQRTFVNGRAVESPTLFRGIRDGYGTLADFGRFPPTVLYLKMDPGEYDINVHPTKREVRFKQDRLIATAVTNACRAALRETPTPKFEIADTPELPLSAVLAGAEVSYHPVPETETELPFAPDAPPAEAAISPAATAAAMPEPPDHSESPLGGGGLTDRNALPAASEAEHYGFSQYRQPQTALPPETEPDAAATESALTAETAPAEPAPALLREEREWRLLGIAMETYLVVEFPEEDCLTLIDFHAAHERVLYEKLLSKDHPVERQILLLPVTLELSRSAAHWLDSHQALLEQLGFECSRFSAGTVMLNAVPAALPPSTDLERLLIDTIDAVLTQERGSDPLTMVARAACHAAVRAHDKLTPTEVAALLKQLKLCERPDVCPHGRPTMLKLPRRDLEKRFGRA